MYYLICLLFDRKAESRVFPQSLQLTVNNLAQFVLANLEVEERLLGMLDLCNRWISKQVRIHHIEDDLQLHSSLYGKY